MEKKEKKLNLVKDNSKFLITIGTCVVLLMVMFYVGTNTSKQTFSATTCGSGEVEHNGKCCTKSTYATEMSYSSGYSNQQDAQSACSTRVNGNSSLECSVNPISAPNTSTGCPPSGTPISGCVIQADGSCSCATKYGYTIYEYSGCYDPNVSNPICTSGECIAKKNDCESTGGTWNLTADNTGNCNCPSGKTLNGGKCVTNTVTYTCSTASITRSAARIVIGGATVTLTADTATNPAGATVNHYEWTVGNGISIVSGNSSKTVTIKADVPTGVNSSSSGTGTYNVKVVYNNGSGGTFNCTASGSIPIDAQSITGITAGASISPSTSNYTKGSGTKTITVQYNAADAGSVDCGTGTWSVTSSNSSYVTLSSVTLSDKSNIANKSTFTYSIKDAAFNNGVSKVTITATFTPTKTQCPPVSKTSTVNLGAASSSTVTKYQCWFCSDGANHWVPETSSPTQAAQSAGITSTYTCSYVKTELNTEAKCNGANAGKGFGYFYDNNGVLYQTLNCTLLKQADGSMECDVKYPTFNCPNGKTFRGWVTSLDVCSTSASGTKAGNDLTFDEDHLSYKRYACCTGGTGGGGDNPGSPSTTPGPYSSDSPIDNPQTGNTLIIIVWLIGILMIGYSVWYFKNGIKNSD